MDYSNLYPVRLYCPNCGKIIEGYKSEDEELMLRALVRAISASPDVKEVVKFSNCEQALDYVKENTIRNLGKVI